VLLRGASLRGRRCHLSDSIKIVVRILVFIKDYRAVVWGVVIFITLLAGFVPLLQVTFFMLLEDFYTGRIAMKDRDKTQGSLAWSLSCGIRLLGWSPRVFSVDCWSADCSSLSSLQIILVMHWPWSQSLSSIDLEDPIGFQISYFQFFLEVPSASESSTHGIQIGGSHWRLSSSIARGIECLQINFPNRSLFYSRSDRWKQKKGGQRSLKGIEGSKEIKESITCAPDYGGRLPTSDRPAPRSVPAGQPINWLTRALLRPGRALAIDLPWRSPPLVLPQTASIP
jgi:hypothetical protein